MPTRISSRKSTIDDPEPQDLGAALLDDLLRLDRVAERLRHLASLLVDEEAVRDDRAVRRPAARAEADEQRALEPAAVLVRPLDVEVGRPRQIVAVAEARPRGSTPSRTRRRGCPARARTRARRTSGSVSPSGRNSSIGRSYHASAPCSANTAAARSASGAVSTASPHFTQSTAGIGTPHDRWREMHQSGRLASISVRRSSPHAGSHETCLTASSALSAQPGAVHRHEPLRRGQEDHRVVAAPAVRVRVLERLAVPEPAAFGQRLLDLRVGVEHALAAEQLDVVEEVAAAARPARRSRGRTSRRW